MSAMAARISSLEGGSPARWRSLSRTDPMSRESRRHDGAVGVAEDQLGRPAADVDDQQRLGQRRQVAGGAGEADPRLLEAVEDLGLYADPLAHPGEELLRVLGVARGRGGAEPDLADVVLRARSACTPRWHRRPAAATPPRSGRCGRRPGRAGRCAARAPAPRSCRRRRRGRRSAAAASWCRSRRRRRGSCGSAPRRSLGRRRRGSTQGPGAPPVAQLVEHLVAERVHAPALGQGLAGEHVQALDPVGHAAGGDAGDLGHLADRGAALEVGLVRPTVRRRELLVLARDARSSRASGRRPRACRSARPPAGRSGRRSSGTACRRRAAARWPPRRGCRTGTGGPTAWIERGGRPSCAATAATSRESMSPCPSPSRTTVTGRAWEWGSARA